MLLALLLGMVAFVLWYVADRRATQHAAPPRTDASMPGPVAPPPVVELGGKNEAKTIDFSSGQPVVTDRPEDRAALESALKDIEAATRDMKFSPPQTKEPAPPGR